VIDPIPPRIFRPAGFHVPTVTTAFQWVGEQLALPGGIVGRAEGSEGYRSSSRHIAIQTVEMARGLTGACINIH